MRPLYALLLACAVNSHFALVARAEQLPVKTYASAEGLAQDHVQAIISDSRGFLWFCTSDGLSRFDGTGFTTYGTKDGLPSAYINNLLETRDGTYLIATNGGMARFNPYAGLPEATGAQSKTEQRATSDRGDNARTLFTAYMVSDEPLSNRVNTLYEDRAGQIWVGTDGGLLRLVKEGSRIAFERFQLLAQPEANRLVDIWQLLEDEEGSLWIATGQGLFRRLPDGRIVHYTIRPSEGTDYVWALLIDKQGRLWAGSRRGLMVIRPEPAAAVASAGEGSLRLMPSGARDVKASASERARLGLPDAAGEARWFTTEDGLAYNYVRALEQSSDGHIWIATHRNGVTEFDGERFRSYTKAQGLIERADALAFDTDGNLWIGSYSDGVMRVARHGFLSYREADGLGSTDIISSFENRAGELYFISDKWFINRFDGTGFKAVRPLLPKHIMDSSASRQEIIQDEMGEWWVSTAEGLYRFPRVERLEDLARTPPKAVYTKSDGMADSNVSRLFEDSRGDIWISSYTPPLTLTRWERSTGVFHVYTEADGMSPLNWANVFAEDAAGNLWMGMHNGGLVRFRHNRFEFFGASDGIPEGLMLSLYLDRSGRLWAATREHGACRIEDPTAERPRVVRYTMAENLSSDNVECFTEDQWGRIYIGTARGLDRLEPATGRVKNFTSGDGLVKNQVSLAFSDRHGALWFGSGGGLSRLVPELDRPQPPPPVLISRLLIDGAARPISELGETELAGLVLEPNQNQLEIDFLGINFRTGNELHYQYMLEGADRDWSAPTLQRTVNYANLQPGSYTFRVRAVNADGVMSQKPAMVSFTILPPIWRRWWFLTIAATIVALVIFAIERYRAARMRELNAALAQSRELTEELTVQRTELHQANRTLELDNTVTRILAESVTLGEAVPKVLQAICESAGWEIGEIWAVDNPSGLLRCVDVWHVPEIEASELEILSRELVLPRGEGLAGSVWETGSPVWVTDIATDKNFTRLAEAVRGELRSAFGFPILSGKEVIGVLEFFHGETRELDADQLEMMSTIGGHIGQLIERKRAEETLRRTKEERLRELERVRARIATDLHDDIGSSLSQIAILSEVVRQRVGNGESPVSDPLALIANSSRELVDSMSDIVWAINPKKDHLSDLLQRMRRFASDTLSARNIEFSFRAPLAEDDIQLGANVRREVFLIFKETINNMVKHSGCTEAKVEFLVESDHLLLRLSDNGRGFDTGRENEGHGLLSMRDRTLGLGGALEIVSSGGQGTITTLRVPLNQGEPKSPTVSS